MQEDPNEKVFGLICKHICNLILQSVDTCGSLGCTLGNSRDTVKAKIVLFKGNYGKYGYKAITQWIGRL